MPGSPHPPEHRPTPAGVPQPALPPSRVPTAVVLAVFVAVYLGSLLFSASRRNATFDEALHLTAGYVALTQGDARFEPTHPPFLRMWAALPLLLQEMQPLDLAQLDQATTAEWGDRSYFIAYHFIHDGGHADRLLAQGRFMNMLWGAALGVMLFLWARAWLGYVPAVCVLGFYVLEPNQAAHFSLVTTDGGVTCFIFGAVYCLWRTQRAWTAGNVAGLVVCGALAVISKFSSVLLIPLLGILLPLAVWRGTTITALRALGIAALLATSAWIAIWAAYDFRYAPGGAGAAPFQLQATEVVREELPRIAVSVAAWVDRLQLLPNAYTQGFLWGQATVEGSMAFLFGQLSTEGWWYYFPAAFLVKTPMMLLLVALAGLVLALGPAGRKEPVNLAFVGLPVAVYLSGAMSTGINIGIRHILPVYPFVLLVAGLAFRALGALPARIGRPALAAVAVIAVLRFAQAYPNTISFFNAFVGGSSRGIEYLADSNLDWGQHLKLLKRWMDREDVKRINLAYFGTVDPAYYGIDYVNLPGSQAFVPESRPQLPGYVAVSATIQTGLYGSVYAGLRDLPPVAVIGHTIRVYWVEQWPEPATGSASLLPDNLLDWQDRIADGLLNDTGWPEEAVRQYQAYLVRRPGDSAVRAKLGLALLQAGRLRDGMAAFTAAVNQDPDGAEMALALAEILWRRGDVRESLVLARRSVEIAPGNQKAREIVAMLTTTLGQKPGAP